MDFHSTSPLLRWPSESPKKFWLGRDRSVTIVGRYLSGRKASLQKERSLKSVATSVSRSGLSISQAEGLALADSPLAYDLTAPLVTRGGSSRLPSHP